MTKNKNAILFMAPMSTNDVTGYTKMIRKLPNYNSILVVTNDAYYKVSDRNPFDMVIKQEFYEIIYDNFDNLHNYKLLGVKDNQTHLTNEWFEELKSYESHFNDDLEIEYIFTDYMYAERYMEANNTTVTPKIFEINEFENIVNYRDVSGSPLLSYTAGLLYSIQNTYPAPKPTADIALIIDNELILGMKKNDPTYHFVGGFSDATDESYEYTAIRELQEETCISVHGSRLQYLGSHRIDDWRYKGLRDNIITHLYIVELPPTEEYLSSLKASDDLTHLVHIPLDELHTLYDKITPQHKVILDKVIRYQNSRTINID